MIFYIHSTTYVSVIYHMFAFLLFNFEFERYFSHFNEIVTIIKLISPKKQKSLSQIVKSQKESEKSHGHDHGNGKNHDHKHSEDLEFSNGASNEKYIDDISNLNPGILKNLQD